MDENLRSITSLGYQIIKKYIRKDGSVIVLAQMETEELLLVTEIKDGLMSNSSVFIRDKKGAMKTFKSRKY